VRVCVHKLTRVKYALKTLNKHRVNGLVRLQRLREEVYMMGALDHPHIVRVHEVFESDQDIFVVMDLCRGGELLDRLHEQRGSRYSEREACRYVHTMLGALRYCHSHNIVHRDLKLENFLFEDRGDDAVLKLIGQ
jgi:calcium-dependent protein kinase